MHKRFLLLAIVSLAMAANSGCCIVNCVSCIHDRWLDCYRSHHWMCSQCGETYYSEWFNDPPDCCDPCDNCGHYVGRRCTNCARHAGDPHMSQHAQPMWDGDE
jgi:hypothetical protein